MSGSLIRGSLILLSGYFKNGSIAAFYVIWLSYNRDKNRITILHVLWINCYSFNIISKYLRCVNLFQTVQYDICHT